MCVLIIIHLTSSLSLSLPPSLLCLSLHPSRPQDCPKRDVCQKLCFTSERLRVCLTPLPGPLKATQPSTLPLLPAPLPRHPSVLRRLPPTQGSNWRRPSEQEAPPDPHRRRARPSLPRPMASFQQRRCEPMVCFRPSCLGPTGLFRAGSPRKRMAAQTWRPLRIPVGSPGAKRPERPRLSLPIPVRSRAPVTPS